MTPNPETVLVQIERIEAEMRRIGLWQDRPLETEQYDFRQAFAMDTMSFTQWLQFIFIPHVREAARTGQFPSESHVAAQAVREFDGQEACAELVALLAGFDELF
jgi:uncharacterized protein YqcC (DUF446 family)